MLEELVLQLAVAAYRLAQAVVACRLAQASEVVASQERACSVE